VEIRAVAGLAALEVDLLDEAVGGKMVEAVVNRGEGDAGRAGFDPVEDVVGRGVVRGGGEDVEDLATVRREAHIGPEDGHAAFEAGGLRRGTGGGDGGWHDGFCFRIGMILKQGSFGRWPLTPSPRPEKRVQTGGLSAKMPTYGN